MGSPKPLTIQDHEETRKKYVNLAWQLYRAQYETGFFVRHPLPEEHLRIEVVMFWRGEISHLSGWTDPVGQIATWLLDQIRGALTWLWTNIIQPGVEILLAGVKWVVAGVLSVVNTISAGVSALGSALSEGLSWIWRQVQGFFSALGEVLKQIGTWIITAIKVHVVDPILNALAPVFEAIKGLIMGLFDFMTGGALRGSPVVWRGSFVRWLGIMSGVGVMAVSGLIGATLIDVIHPFKDTKAGDVAKFAMQFSGITFLQAAFFTTYFDVACARPVRQELNAIFTPEIPSVEDATRMLWRGKISSGDFDEVVKLRGYADPWASGYKALTEQLPGTQDLTLEVVREVIPPELFYVLMPFQGLTRDITTLVPEAEAMFTKAGLPVLKNTAQWIWEAHWILPPPERTRTAFLRKQIPEEAYRKFLVWYDFKPEPRPGIPLSDVDIMLKTQYDWPGRLDTRWLLEWGEITPEDGVELTKAEGFDPQWAPRLVRVWLLNQVREELGKVRTVYEKALREGFLNPVSFAEKLVGINYAPHVINALKLWADEELALAEKLELAGEYEKLAKDQIITPEQFSQALRELNMVEERITRKVNYLKRYLAVLEIKAAAKAAAAAKK